MALRIQILKHYVVLQQGNVAIKLPRIPEFVKEKNGKIIAIKLPTAGAWVPISLLLQQQ